MKNENKINQEKLKKVIGGTEIKDGEPVAKIKTLEGENDDYKIQPNDVETIIQKKKKDVII